MGHLPTYEPGGQAAGGRQRSAMTSAMVTMRRRINGGARVVRTEGRGWMGGSGTRCARCASAASAASEEARVEVRGRNLVVARPSQSSRQSNHPKPKKGSPAPASPLSMLLAGGTAAPARVDRGRPQVSPPQPPTPERSAPPPDADGTDLPRPNPTGRGGGGGTGGASSSQSGGRKGGVRDPGCHGACWGAGGRVCARRAPPPPVPPTGRTTLWRGPRRREPPPPTRPQPCAAQPLPGGAAARRRGAGVV